jgi:hypothetical protein
MSLNARQKRTRKRKLALAALAASRNPPTVAREGIVRSVWTKTMPPRARIPFHSSYEPKRDSASRFKQDEGAVVKALFEAHIRKS